MECRYWLCDGKDKQDKQHNICDVGTQDVCPSTTGTKKRKQMWSQAHGDGSRRSIGET